MLSQRPAKKWARQSKTLARSDPDLIGGGRTDGLLSIEMAESFVHRSALSIQKKSALFIRSFNRKTTFVLLDKKYIVGEVVEL